MPLFSHLSVSVPPCGKPMEKEGYFTSTWCVLGNRNSFPLFLPLTTAFYRLLELFQASRSECICAYVGLVNRFPGRKEGAMSPVFGKCREYGGGELPQRVTSSVSILTVNVWDPLDSQLCCTQLTPRSSFHASFYITLPTSKSSKRETYFFIT